MRIAAVGMEDLLTLEEAVANLLQQLGEYRRENKAEWQAIDSLALHFEIAADTDSLSDNQFRLSLDAEGEVFPEELGIRIKTIATGKALEIPAGVARTDLERFFALRLAQILACQGWTQSSDRSDDSGFLAGYQRL